MKKLTLSREAKIGAVVVIAIGMLYFGLNFLKGINIFQPTTYFYAQYDRIDGIVQAEYVYEYPNDWEFRKMEDLK